MRLVLKVPGDPESLRNLAAYLRDALVARYEELVLQLRGQGAESEYVWNGAAADAFRERNRSVWKSIETVPLYARDFLEVVDAYAARLERLEHDLAAVKERALAGGLSVFAEELQPPQPPASPCPSLEDPDTMLTPDGREWHAHVARQRLYSEIADDLGREFGRLQEWIDTYFGQLYGRIVEFEQVRSAWAVWFGDETGFAKDVIVESVSQSSERRVSDLRTQAQDVQGRANAQLSAMSGGDPQIARSTFADSFASHGGADAAASSRSLEAHVARATSLNHFLTAGGGVFDIASSAIELGLGSPPSTVAAGAGGGIAGTWLGRLSAGVLGLGTGGGAVAVAFAAGAGTASARATWESTFTLEQRENVDRWIDDHVFFVDENYISWMDLKIE